MYSIRTFLLKYPQHSPGVSEIYIYIYILPVKNKNYQSQKLFFSLGNSYVFKINKPYGTTTEDANYFHSCIDIIQKLGMFVYRQSLGVAGAYTFEMRRRCLWVLWISTHYTSTTRLGCPAWPWRRKQLGQLSSSWRALGHAAVPVLHLVPRLTSSELGSFLSQSILFLSRRGAA